MITTLENVTRPYVASVEIAVETLGASIMASALAPGPVYVNVCVKVQLLVRSLSVIFHLPDDCLATAARI